MVWQNGLVEVVFQSPTNRSVLTRLIGQEVRRIAVLHGNDLTVSNAYFGAAGGRWEPRETADGEVLRPEWGERTGDLYLNPTTYLAHVPERVWRFRLGGYPVVKKWLGYRDEPRRRGPLTIQEMEELVLIIRRLTALLALHSQLDTAYEAAAADAARKRAPVADGHRPI